MRRAPTRAWVAACGILLVACGGHARGAAENGAAGAAAVPSGNWTTFDYNSQRSGVGPADIGIGAANVGRLGTRVVHIDGTVRPQTVEREVNPRYWDLIDAFGRLSGERALLNTSFNVKGEPIVCSPRDAIRTFYDTGLDCLVMGDNVLTKPRSAATRRAPARLGS